MARRIRLPKLEKVSKQVGAIEKKPRFVRAESRLTPKGVRYGGRQKGTPNRLPVLLKDALMEAAERAGNHLAPVGKRGEAATGLVNYLTHQAVYNPQSFLPLLGKVLPLQIDTGGAPILQVQNIEIVVLQPGDDPGSHKAGLIEIDGTAEVVADGDGDTDGDG